jgi:hypothetical protein
MECPCNLGDDKPWPTVLDYSWTKNYYHHCFLQCWGSNPGLSACLVSVLLGVIYSDPKNGFYTFIYFFLWDWCLNSGLSARKAGTVPWATPFTFLIVEKSQIIVHDI